MNQIPQESRAVRALRSISLPPNVAFGCTFGEGGLLQHNVAVFGGLVRIWGSRDENRQHWLLTPGFPFVEPPNPHWLV